MRSGREGRFEAVYRECLPDVKTYAASRVGRADVDDVVSATFMSVWQRLDDVPWESQRAWVLGVCRNQCRNRWRSDRRFAALVNEVRAARPRLEDGLSRHGMDVDLLASVEPILESLSAADRELFVLASWLGFTPSEVAEVLGVPSGTVRVRLHRLRNLLSERLGEDRGGGVG